MQIVPARAEHLDGIAAIYAAVVVSSAATFDLAVPTDDQWQATLDSLDPEGGHAMFVAVDEGRVIGYAKSGRFRERAAYDTTCETSIYVAEEARGRGVGRAVYGALVELLEQSPLRLAVAGVAVPNPASEALHRSLGFTEVGTFRGVGFKFDRPWDVTWWQRSLLAAGVS